MAVQAASLIVRFQSEGADRVRSDLQGLGRDVDAAGQKTSRLGGLVGGLGTIMAAGFVPGFKAAGDLEQVLTNIEATLGSSATPAVMGDIASAVRDIGSNSQYSATQVGSLMDQLLRAGTAPDQVIAQTEAVVNLASATGESLEVSTLGVIQAMNTWSEAMVGPTLAMTDASHVADVFTVAANNSAGGVQDIIMGMRPLGPVAASLGISFEESAAAIALFTNYGMKGADAGISLARGFTNLATPSADLNAKLGELGLSMESMGIQAFDAQGNFVGMPALFDQLSNGMKGLDDQTKLAALSLIFGAEAADVMFQAIQMGGDPLRNMIELMGQEGIAAEQAAKRTQTLWGALQRLTESVSTMLGVFVAPLLPAMTAFADFIANLATAASRLPGPIKAAIGALMGFFLVMRGLKGLAAAGPLLSMFGAGGIAAKAAAFIPIVRALMIAAGLLALAWKTNFLGIRDFGEAIGDALDTVGDHFQMLMRNGMDPFSAAIGSLGYIAFKVGDLLGWDWLQDVGIWFAQAANTARDFVTYLELVWRYGDVSQAILERLPAPLRGVATAMGDLVDIARDFVVAWREGGVMGVLAELAPNLQQLADVAGRVGDMLTGVALDLFDWTLNVGAPAVVNFLGDIGTWIMDNVPGALVEIADWVAHVLAPAAMTGLQNLGTWISDNLGAALVTIAEWVGHVLAPAALTGLENLGQWISDNLGAALVEIADWVLAVGAPTAVQWLGDLASWIGDKINELVVPVTNWIAELDGYAVGVQLVNAGGILLLAALAVGAVLLAGIVLPFALPLLIPAVVVAIGIGATLLMYYAITNWIDGLTFEEEINIVILGVTIAAITSDVVNGIIDQIEAGLGVLGINVDLQLLFGAIDTGPLDAIIDTIPGLRGLILVFEGIELAVKAVGFAVGNFALAWGALRLAIDKTFEVPGWIQAIIDKLGFLEDAIGTAKTAWDALQSAMGANAQADATADIEAGEEPGRSGQMVVAEEVPTEPPPRWPEGPNQDAVNSAILLNETLRNMEQLGRRAFNEVSAGARSFFHDLERINAANGLIATSTSTAVAAFGSLGAAVAAVPPLEITADVSDVEAKTSIARTLIEAFNGMTARALLQADSSNAIAGALMASTAARAFAGGSYIGKIGADASGALSAIASATGAGAAFAARNFVASIGADASSFFATVGGIAGRVVGTAFINVQARVSGLGGAAANIPGFADGGVVPGPIGAPRLILAHGGETVLPTHRTGGGGNITVNVTVQGSVITERELYGNVTRAVGSAIRDDLIRHRVAVGATS